MRLALEIIAFSLVAVLAVLAALFGRREVITAQRGTVELYLRMHSRTEGRGWAPGFAQFRGDELRWFRMFSLVPRPHTRLSRRRLVVESRRGPNKDESLLIPSEWIILRCFSEAQPVEIAMARHTATGFLSWLESATPYST